MKQLLERGADIYTKNTVGDTALMVAAEAGHLAVATELLKRNASVEIWNDEGITETNLARANGYQSLAGEIKRQISNL